MNAKEAPRLQPHQKMHQDHHKTGLLVGKEKVPFAIKPDQSWT